MSKKLLICQDALLPLPSHTVAFKFEPNNFMKPCLSVLWKDVRRVLDLNFRS